MARPLMTMKLRVALGVLSLLLRLMERRYRLFAYQPYRDLFPGATSRG